MRRRIRRGSCSRDEEALPAQCRPVAARVLDQRLGLGDPQRLAPALDGAGERRLAVESRAASANLAETQAFQDDEKRILVFSDAGGTGRSYHADLGARNRRLRVHYLLEAGWKADTAIQGLGRTNRTNQAQPPLFRPIATDVKAEKRFLSTIARRLDTLGAITKGQRQTGGQGLFRPEDNLESVYARAALRQLYTVLYAGRIEGCTLQRFQDATGLTLTDRDGTLKEELPPITQFLNRLLALTIDLQNTLFAAFEALLEAKIEGAVASGTYDAGVETIAAASLRIVQRRTIYTHPGTGAATQVFTIARRDRNEPLSLGEALEQGAKRRLLLNGKSHRAAVQIPAPSVMLDDGTVERRVRLVRPLERPSIAVEALQATAWRPTEPEAFAVAWEAEVAQLPEFRESTLHIVTGLLLPIWRQLPHDGGRVYRLQTDDGERVIGRQMSPAWVAAASARVPELSPDDAMAGLVGGRMVLHLADGLQLRRVRVMHAHRIELIGFTDTMRDRLTAVYLRNRGIADVGDLPALRFHPTCFYRGHEGAPRETSSALLAAVTDPEGVVTGVLRTWLARDGSGKAPLATPRLSMGRLLGHGVRLGDVQPAPAQAGVLAAGEGLETMLSLRVILPALPVVAALSATHLAGFIPPSGLRRLYIARDNDRVGRRAAEMLGARANAEGIEALVLTPHWDDFNTDLTTLGREALAASLRVQFTPEDVERFLVVDRRPDPRPRQRAPVPDPSSPSAAPGLQNGDGAGSG